MIPNTKLIALLREPASRAVSHFHHQVRSGVETRPIDEVFSAENIARWESGECPDLHARYYFKWSDYATGLEQWLRYYTRDQLLVLEAEHMFANHDLAIKQVCEFLEVEPCSITKSGAFNVGGRNALKPKTFDSLTRAFTRQNESLVELNYPMSWT